LESWGTTVTLDTPMILARRFGIYKENGAMEVRTDPKPRTASKPAEHLIIVLFPKPEFIEAAFARFVILGGKGRSIVYSHRIYGKKAGDPMSAWLRKNGERCEKNH
jgi:hypothetical protein